MFIEHGHSTLISIVFSMRRQQSHCSLGSVLLWSAEPVGCMQTSVKPSSCQVSFSPIFLFLNKTPRSGPNRRSVGSHQSLQTLCTRTNFTVCFCRRSKFTQGIISLSLSYFVWKSLYFAGLKIGLAGERSEAFSSSGGELLEKSRAWKSEFKSLRSAGKSKFFQRCCF